MLILVFAAIVFFFLVVGAAVFIACSLIPQLRRYALSSALWCAVWGPCTVAWITLGGLALVASHFAMEGMDKIRHFHPPTLPPRGPWIAYAALYLSTTILTATLIAWMHQFVEHRMTLRYFESTQRSFRQA